MLAERVPGSGRGPDDRGTRVVSGFGFQPQSLDDGMFSETRFRGLKHEPCPLSLGDCVEMRQTLVWLIVAACLAAGCRQEEAVVSTSGPGSSEAWLDHPAVRAVAFHPRRDEARPAAVTSDVCLLTVPVADGVTVGGRFHLAGTNFPTILLFHGNGEIASDYDDMARCYAGLRLNLLVADYRGYGRSTGAPTVSTLLTDAVATYRYSLDWLHRAGYTAPVIVMGRSLGSAAALEVASRFPELPGLIIESGFAYLVPLLERLGAVVPPRAEAALDPARHVQKIRSYEGPTLIIHGERDQIIPIGDARALYAASASEQKRLVTIPDGGHNTLLTVGFDAYMRAIADFTAPLRPAGAEPLP